MNEIIKALKARGFPHAQCKAEVQFTVNNSALMKVLGKNSEPFTLDIHSIEERGLVLGLRSQIGHKSLYEWNKILRII